jgi:hypothetical protein
MSRATMNRLIKLLDQWISVWASLAGAAVPQSEAVRDDAPSSTEGCTDLKAQLDEILEFVVVQERRWRPKSQRNGSGRPSR